MDIFQLCDRIRQTAFDVHAYHGHGYLEKVYENALTHRLRKAGFEVDQQYSMEIFDEDGTLLGRYTADLLVEKRLLIEVKAVKLLAPEHTTQILAYLKSTRIEHGLLINFGSFKFQIRKLILTRRRGLGFEKPYAKNT